jgi:DNA polymerase III delta subunit
VGRAAPAIVKLRELIDLAGQPDVLTLYFVADLIRKLYLAKRMQRQGMARGTIGRELKLFGSREKLFMDALNRLGEQRISDLFDLILRLDLRSKSGLGDARRNLEAFCATL